MLEDIPQASTSISHISLMRSERGKKGMIYTEIGTIGAIGTAGMVEGDIDHEQISGKSKRT